MNQLTYETFSKEILQLMQEELGPERRLMIHKVKKNNNVEYDGIIIDHEDSPVSPTFYMEQFYQEYQKGVPLKDIVDFAMPYYEKNYSEAYFNLQQIEKFEKVKDRVVFKLVNFETNKELLKDVPYLNYLDLAVIFHCALIDGNDQMGRVIVTNQMLKDWGIKLTELYAVAAVNTKRLFGLEIKDIQEVIVDMVLDSNEFIHPPLPEVIRQDLIREIKDQVVRFPIYVLSNKSRVNGAVCMLYKEIGVFADQIGDDLYIIPSSVHEVLLVPVSEEISSHELSEVLHEVNRDEIDEVDYLSDKIYFYSRETRRVSL